MGYSHFEEYAATECRRLEATQRARALQLQHRARWEHLLREHRRARRRQLAWLLGMRLLQLGDLLCRWAMRGQGGQHLHTSSDAG